MDRDKLARRIYKRHQDVKVDDLLLYIKEYMEIRELEERYLNEYTNRKKLSDQIEERKKNIKLLSEIFEYTLKINSPTPIQDTITDLNLTFRVILSLANKDYNQYSIKKFRTSGYSFHETNNGNRERSLVEGDIYLIGRSDILYKIDNERKYFGNEFGTITSDIVRNGNSLIVFTDYYFDYSIKPDVEKKDDLSIIFFDVEKTYNKLSCYLYDADDDLKEVVNKFKEFIEKNGADIKGIPLDILRKNIDNVHDEERVVEKVKSRGRKKKEELKNYDGVVFYYE